MSRPLPSDTPPHVREALRRTVAIIPVWNEEAGIGLTLDDLPEGLVPIVVDNGSTDRTMEIVRSRGAHLIHEEKKGYGVVLKRGIREIPGHAPEALYVTFVDGDHADHTEEIPDMLRHVAENRYDMVIGSRVAGESEPGALPLQSRFAIWYARLLLWRLFRVRCTDIGPLRVLRIDTLARMDMQDDSWGWTVEMQAKAARLNLRVLEVPTRYRKRPGHSKISGALKTAAKAGWKILLTEIKWRFKPFASS
jgi:glycosyltransferase involved in cell wall biosynthesis